MNRSFVPLVALAIALPTLTPLHSVRAADAPAAATQPASALFAYTSALDFALNGKIDKNGMVDYVAMKDDKNLALFVKALETANTTDFPTWEFPVDPNKLGNDGKPLPPKIDRGPELVFWINAYNGLVLKTLSDAYPVNGPDDIAEFDTAANYTVGGKKYSLSDIREIVAKIDPRALFTLSEGTIGGPTIATQAYRFRNIYGSLDARVTAFCNDDRNIQVMRISNEVTLSDFFATLDGHFGSKSDRKKYPAARYVLATYSASRADRSYLNTNDYQIILKPRNRRLNIQEK